MPQPALGFLLQSLREERGLSLRELAQLADTDHAYIYRLETGGKESPSEDVLSKLIRALKAGRREADMLRYLAKHAETDSALVAHVLKDPTVTYEIFASAAGAAFRGTGRPDYLKLIERVRRILGEETGRG
jgi:transcriptional regulator with XRE-family HTH domain